jgi:hypothetical protein
MNASDTARPADFTLAQRAQAQTLSRRRRRLAWRVILFTIITAVMIFVAVINRDTMELRDQRRIGALMVKAFERKAAERHSPPLTFPYETSPIQTDLPYERFYLNIFYAGQARPGAPSGVCCLKQPVSFYIRTEGRTVILYDGAHFDSEWMTESEFRSRAQELGFSYLLTNTD